MTINHLCFLCKVTPLW